MADNILNFASTLAQEAGQMAQDLRTQSGADFVALKGAGDFVTQADRAVEMFIRARIAARFPDHGILGEEHGGAFADQLWIIDPIDGTTNYLKGLPDWGVCIAFAQNGTLSHGVIACPDHQIVAAGAIGRGAWLNDTALRGRAENAIALVQIGYSVRTGLADHLDHIARVIEYGADYRRSGAACIGLLSVAAGWSDVFYEGHLNLWDAAAGLVLVSQAGGQCHHAPLDQFARAGSSVLALNASVAQQAAQWQGLFAN